MTRKETTEAKLDRVLNNLEILNNQVLMMLLEHQAEKDQALIDAIDHSPYGDLIHKQLTGK